MLAKPSPCRWLATTRDPDRTGETVKCLIFNESISMPVAFAYRKGRKTLSDHFAPEREKVRTGSPPLRQLLPSVNSLLPGLPTEIAGFPRFSGNSCVLPSPSEAPNLARFCLSLPLFSESCGLLKKVRVLCTAITVNKINALAERPMRTFRKTTALAEDPGIETGPCKIRAF